MDNFSFKMTSEGKEQLKKAMSLFPQDKVVAYREDNIKGLIFYWCESTKSKGLPFPMSIDEASDFAWGWLQYADYGREPDHDGSNGKGWMLYNEGCGHVDNEYQAFVAIKPIWAIYGK